MYLFDTNSLYCLKVTIKANSKPPFEYSCRICESCLAFLKMNSIYLCPLCPSTSLHDSPSRKSKNSTISLRTILDSPNQHSNSTLPLKELEILCSYLKGHSKSLGKKKNSLKTLIALRNIKKIMEFQSYNLNFSTMRKKIGFIKEMNIFQYNQQYLLIIFQDYLNSCAIEMERLSKLALFREKNKIDKLEDYYFFGDKITFSVINNGIINHKFKFLSEKTCQLLEIGIGRSIGLNSSIFLIKLLIYEDSQLIYSEELMYELNNEDSLLSLPLKLTSPIPLKNKSTYELLYIENVNYQYSLQYPKKIMDYGDIKLQSIEFSGIGDITIYLRIQKVTI